ncbi:MAG TPA: deoxyribodipyrimidine photo-lyase [Gammaproteobacteria bacterium]|nr:deoxyribodipyrimidine photo-lyase [Gammaproteobacteria bacterium]
MNEAPLSLVWFRRDLRISDNPALRAAAAAGPILPVYILDDLSPGAWSMGAASRAWLHRSLQSLDRSLNGGLRYFTGDAAEVIAALVAALSIRAVYWNRCYEPWCSRRDTQIKAALAAAGIEVESFNASLLWEPWQVRKPDGDPYRVFTPFYRKGCLSREAPREPLAPPDELPISGITTAGNRPLDGLELLPRENWHCELTERWQIGEPAAQLRLEEFCETTLANYRDGRDYPALEATSRLSPNLCFGEISPHQAWHRAEQAAMHEDGDGPGHFQRELAWREFSYHLLYHFPELPEKNFNRRFDAFDWRDNPEGLEAWKRGLTGFPIVDAGMRELWQTGYMHNRVRMIVASFLIKNLGIHWRAGEDWFWDCLVDADLANNSASWQWVAGSGADAAPYFRIFNPLLQSEKFDPAGEYLARYCPELAGLPPKLRHRPWDASAAELRRAGIELGADYPRPILDLKTTRERALRSFKALP